MCIRDRETPEPQPEKKAVLSTFKQISDREDIDFEGLAETNEDFVAWLSVPGTAVDYPVVYKADDNFYYLDIDFEGNESKQDVYKRQVTENPTKITYTVGDIFSPAGLEVTAHYTNGGADKVLMSGEYTLSTPDMSAAGTKTITVTYEEDGVEKTATFDITVNAPVPVLDSIEVTAEPTKTTYTVGDTFDAAGLEITAHYTNGGVDKMLTSGEYTLSAPCLLYTSRCV